MIAVLPQGWQEDVHAFWFTDLGPGDWFRRDTALDARIAGRFATLHQRVAGAALLDLTADGATSLAAVIVLDQFSRNMFRDSPRAFASDSLAIVIARQAVAWGFDTSLTPNERLFLYLPFEHSEAMADQDTAVRLISALGDAQYTRYAIAHRDIIARFSRFPHRNRVLGRASTPEETAFLATPGSSF